METAIIIKHNLILLILIQLHFCKETSEINSPCHVYKYVRVNPPLPPNGYRKVMLAQMTRE